MRCRFIVSGRVQGVFYRKYTQQAAREKNITGYVRNLDNGDVEIVAEGTAEQLNELEMWCYVGSPLSKVMNVQREILDNASNTNNSKSSKSVNGSENARQFRSFTIVH